MGLSVVIVKTWNAGGVLLCLVGMAIVGSSVAVSRNLLDYPTLTGQALRYTVAALILAAIAARTPLPTATARPAGTAQLAGAARPAGSGRLTPRELGILAALAASGLAAFNGFV